MPEQPNEHDQSFRDQLKEIETRKKELGVEEELLINKAIGSDNPADIVKAMNVVEINKNVSNDWRKSAFVDPYQFDANFGYKRTPSRMTYETLSAMSRSPIINAIVRTRKNQIAAFSEPQKDRFSTGFIIRKKGYFVENQGKKLNKEDMQRIEDLTEFILNCGVEQSWSRDDFDTFLRKVTEDSLTYDQMTWENIREVSGAMHEYIVTDSTTMRIADSYSDKDYRKEVQARQVNYVRKEIGGYYPSYVQVINNEVVAQFYPWELAFGVRNPTARLHSNGYGRSELEELVSTVTSMLWSDQYNRNFFKLGAAPKGIIRLKGGANNARLQEFRQQWKAMIAGVDNAWRTPIIDSESMEWIDLQKSHRDMEFTKWQEYLIKLSCALYVISPEEIGFDSGRSDKGAQMFENNNAQRIKYSQDKGLKPLLKFLQSKINKYIVSQIEPDLVFEFVGLNTENEETYRKRVLDEVQNLKTIDEVREDMELKPMPDGKGDMILNPTYIQAEQMKQMAEQEQAMAEQGEEGEEGAEGFSPEQKDAAFKEPEENPFAKSFNEMITDLEKGM